VKAMREWRRDLSVSAHRRDRKENREPHYPL
jgi:hypothetical protein